MTEQKGTYATKRKKNLLIDEYPLLVLPSLATSIGLNEAIALQQLHYWLENPKGGIEMDGFRWVYNTYENWKEDNFPFWSVRTIQRVFTNLESLGLVISMQKANYDRKKYYRVHYDNLASWNETDCHNAEFQVDTMEDDKVASSLTETTEITTETTQKFGGLSEKDWNDANKKFEAMVEQTKKLKYTNRDKMPETYLSYCDLYVELCGKDNDGIYVQVPTKRVFQDWMMVFEEWKQENLKPEHITAAFQYANRPDGGFPVGRPGSLTNTAVAMKTKMVGKSQTAPAVSQENIEATKKMLEEKEVKAVPMPEHLRRRVKETLSQVSNIAGNLFPERATNE